MLRSSRLPPRPPRSRRIPRHSPRTDGPGVRRPSPSADQAGPTPHPHVDVDPLVPALAGEDHELVAGAELVASTRPGRRRGGQQERACPPASASPVAPPWGSGTPRASAKNFCGGGPIFGAPTRTSWRGSCGQSRSSRRHGPQAGTPRVCHPVPMGPPAGSVKTPGWRVAVRSVTYT
jgi:hypothetical protein